MNFIIYLLIYVLVVILSIAAHVLYEGIDSFDKWNREQDYIDDYGFKDKTISLRTEILCASVFWFIYIPMKLFYLVIATIVCIFKYIFEKLLTKFLIVLFNINKKINSKK